MRSAGSKTTHVSAGALDHKTTRETLLNVPAGAIRAHLVMILDKTLDEDVEVPATRPAVQVV